MSTAGRGRHRGGGSRRASRPSGRHARRPPGRLDIQGLRALAVLVVVSHHLVGWPHGGFVGVDVFFVISGFLITGLLVREWTATGSIGFASFYRRRVRRLLPSAVLVIVTTCVAAVAIFGRPRADSVLLDGTWAAAFAANWRFAAVGTDYFNADATSPLQHYWSLAVEEQFYLAWPVIIVAAATLAARHRTTIGRWVLPGTIAVIVVASLSYALWHARESPTYAYFSTLDRVWELGVGALLAVLLRGRRALPRWVAAAFGWSGLGIIVLAVLVIDERSTFPAPWALLPVLGAALVLAGGASSEQRHLVPLVNPLATYIGNISYSLYLWHFPVTILLLALYPGGGARYVAVAVLLMTALSIWSYHAVENPIRHSTWLDPQRRGRTIAPSIRWGWGLATVAILASFTVVQLRDDSTPPLPAYELVSSSERSLAEQQTEQLQDALKQVTFPAQLDGTAPTFADWAERMQDEYCIDVSPANVQSCRWGEGDRLAVVYGDSQAMAWMPAARRALADAGYRVQQLTVQQCPAWTLSVLKEDGSPYPECDEFHRWALSTIDGLSPDLVITSSSFAAATRLAAGGGADAITSGLRATADRIVTGTGARVVNLSSPPGSGRPSVCYSAFTTPQDCILPVQDAWREANQAEQAAGNLVHVDTLDWFCESGRCPAYIGSSPIYTDGAHLDLTFAETIAPLLEERLTELGVIQRD